MKVKFRNFLTKQTKHAKLIFLERNRKNTCLRIWAWRSFSSISSTELGDLHSVSRSLRRSRFGNLTGDDRDSSSPIGNSITIPFLPSGNSTPAAITIQRSNDRNKLRNGSRFRNGATTAMKKFYRTNEKIIIIVTMKNMKNWCGWWLIYIYRERER